MSLTLLCCFTFMAVAVFRPMTAYATTDGCPTDPAAAAAVVSWYHNVLPTAKTKLTELHFYCHEIRVADIPNTQKIAEANTSSSSATNFGRTYVFDDFLTVTPDPGSQIIGRLQGAYSSTSQEEFAFILMMNVVFTNEKYNGSTISILGRDPIRHKSREYPVLGGSGVFRLARGSAVAHTYALDPVTLNAIVECTVIVQHYE